MNKTEGFISVEGGKVWYQIIGDQGNIPLIVLHGGPGYPHDYLEPLEDSATNRQVIFYDQLGCGNSDKTTDPVLWTVENFVKELCQVIETLKLEKYHILGHSWGSALAVAFALTKLKGLTSLVLSDPYISTPIWEKEMQRLLELLPDDMRNALLNNKKESDKYKQASKEFYHRFVWRMNSYPESCKKSFKKKNADLYNYMWGPEEFQATGTLANFDPSLQFSEIKVPVLLICGRYDEATPESCEYFRNRISNAKLEILENSAHFPFWNEREKYMKIVQSFLNDQV